MTSIINRALSIKFRNIHDFSYFYPSFLQIIIIFAFVTNWLTHLSMPFGDEPSSVLQAIAQLNPDIHNII